MIILLTISKKLTYFNTLLVNSQWSHELMKEKTSMTDKLLLSGNNENGKVLWKLMQDYLVWLEQLPAPTY